MTSSSDQNPEEVTCAQRRNCLSARGRADGERFITGVRLLKQEQAAGELSTYDSFVLWHFEAMHALVNGALTNLAHEGPVFLPWHRYLLLLFERHLQRVLQDKSFGIPYWNWWEGWPESMGGIEATEGPFAFKTDGTGFNVVRRLDINDTTRMTLEHIVPPRFEGLRRELGPRAAPDITDVARAMSVPHYDCPPWSTKSISFRNLLEGHIPGSGATHNAAHYWVGGDMVFHTSPNEPVFFLLHSGVDRIWAAWERRHRAFHESLPGSRYAPGDGEADPSVEGHRPGDPLWTMEETSTIRIVDVLTYDEQLYSYDTLKDLLDLGH